MPEHSSGKKGRKVNRALVKCSRYKSEHRRTKNNPLRTPRPEERTPHAGHRREKYYGPPKRAAVSPGNGRPNQRWPKTADTGKVTGRGN